MSIEHSHFIQTQLSNIVSTPDTAFEQVFSFLNHTQKEQNRSFFIYVDKVISFYLNNDSEKLNYLHIHLPYFQDEDKSALLEFISIKFFFLAINNKIQNSGSENSECFAKSKYTQQVEKRSAPIMLKEGESGRSKKFQKKVEAGKKHLAESKDFWLKLSEIGTIREEYLSPDSLILLSKSRNEYLKNGLFKNFQFATSIEDHAQRDCNVVLMNHAHNISEVHKNFDKSIITNIRNVVTIHSHKADVLTDFNFNTLLKYKKQKVAPFQNLILLSFARDKTAFRLGKTMERMTMLTSKYRFPEKEKQLGVEYWLHPAELGINNNNIENLFKGKPTNVFFDEIHEFIKENDFDNELRELVSLRMFNVYASCCSEKFKTILLQDIFDANIESKIIHPNTKKRLLELKSNKGFLFFKQAFTNFLDFIRGHGGWLEILGEINKYTQPITLVISDKVFHHEELLQELKNRLNKNDSVFTTWSKVFDEVQQNQNVIFLAYKDCGRNFDLFPSLLEIPYLENAHFKGIFLRFMFENRYFQTKYKYEKQLYLLSLKNTFRVEKMNWDRLQIQKPTKNEEDSLFDLESNYSSESETESVTIGGKSYYPTQRFLIQLDEEARFFVIKVSTLLEDYIGQYKIKGILLSEIIDKIDLFELKQKEVDELKQIEDTYHLTNEERKGQLWRALLKRKEASGISAELMYNAINEISEKNNAKMVSKNHFNHSWLNLQDENLVPRSKALFKSLADYLELSRSYVQLMLRKRANIRGTSRQNTDNMNELIEQIVSLDLLDENINNRNILLEKVIAEQELNDYGLDINDLSEYVKFINNCFQINAKNI